MRRQQVLRRAAREGRLPREQFVCEHADRIDVRAVVHTGIGARLLGRHVRRCAERHAERRHAAVLRVARGAQRLRDAEIRDHRAAAREQHVVGLDVAVHDSVFVRIRERGGDLAQHANGMVDGQLAVPREANPQRLAVHERHREVRQAVRLARGEQRHDVWMLELGRKEDLALETFERDLRRGLRREHLDHDLAVERGLLGDEHARHPTAAEFALERVASAQGRLQLVA